MGQVGKKKKEGMKKVWSNEEGIVERKVGEEMSPGYEKKLFARIGFSGSLHQAQLSKKKKIGVNIGIGFYFLQRLPRLRFPLVSPLLAVILLDGNPRLRGRKS